MCGNKLNVVYFEYFKPLNTKLIYRINQVSVNSFEVIDFYFPILKLHYPSMRKKSRYKFMFIQLVETRWYSLRTTMLNVSFPWKSPKRFSCRGNTMIFARAAHPFCSCSGHFLTMTVLAIPSRSRWLNKMLVLFLFVF